MMMMMICNYFILSTTIEVIRPYECREPLNQTAMDLFPLNTFDPLHIDNKTSYNLKSHLWLELLFDVLHLQSLFRSIGFIYHYESKYGTLTRL